MPNPQHPFPDPDFCDHVPVPVPEGNECLKCGKVALVMPRPSQVFMNRIPGRDTNLRKVRELKAMLANKRQSEETWRPAMST